MSRRPEIFFFVDEKKKNIKDVNFSFFDGWNQFFLKEAVKISRSKVSFDVKEDKTEFQIFLFIIEISVMIYFTILSSRECTLTLWTDRHSDQIFMIENKISHWFRRSSCELFYRWVKPETNSDTRMITAVKSIIRWLTLRFNTRPLRFEVIIVSFSMNVFYSSISQQLETKRIHENLSTDIFKVCAIISCVNWNVSFRFVNFRHWNICW